MIFNNINCILFSFVLLSFLIIPFISQTPRCKLNVELTNKNGIINDGMSSCTISYIPPIHCHWKISTKEQDVTLSIQFNKINLREEYVNKDVILLNIGPNGNLPPIWKKYTRSIVPNTSLNDGMDDIGIFEYSKTDETQLTCISKQYNIMDPFNPEICHLLYGTTLNDTLWDNHWYYITGSTINTQDLKQIQATGQTIYIIFRSFGDIDSSITTSNYSDKSKDGNSYGFEAIYSLLSAFCNNLTIIDTRFTMGSSSITDKYPFSDNMKNLYRSNMSCSWIIRPTREKNYLFDSIWITFKSFVLADINDKVIIYNGDTIYNSILVQLNGSSLPLIQNQIFKSTVGSILVTFISDHSLQAEGFKAHWQASYCPNSCNKNGKCIMGTCQCLNGWEGIGCTIPSGWICGGIHYNSSDGCDCACGVYDPDCGPISNPIKDCKEETIQSLDDSFYNSMEGKFYSGICVRCPLSSYPILTTSQPENSWNTTAKTFIHSCPDTKTCKIGEVCDSSGLCVSLNSKEKSSDTFKKTCNDASDCSNNSDCVSNVCQILENIALVFDNSTSNVRQNKMDGLSTTNITITIHIRITLSLPNDKIFEYSDVETNNIWISLKNSLNLILSINNNDFVTGISLADGLWHDLAFTWQSLDGLLNFFYDKILYSSQQIALGSLLPTELSFSIGGFVGVVTNLQIWSIIRTQEQIQKPFNLSELLIEDGLVSLYRFQDGNLYDLTTNGNHLTSIMAEIKPEHSIPNKCLHSPVVLTEEFVSGYHLRLSSTWLSGDAFAFEFQTENKSISLGIEIHSDLNIKIYSDYYLNVTFNDSFGLKSGKAFWITINKTASDTFLLCFFDKSCITQMNENSDNIEVKSVVINPLNSTFSSIPCIIVAQTSTILSSIINSNRSIYSIDSIPCSFPFQYTTRDCDKFNLFVAKQGIDINELVLLAKDYHTNVLELDYFNCSCSSNMIDSWAVNVKYKYVSLTNITIEIKYKHIRTVSVAENIFPLPLNGVLCGTIGTSLSGDNCIAETHIDSPNVIVQYFKLRDFYFYKNSTNWEIQSASDDQNVSKELCLVSEDDIPSINSQVTAYECQKYGTSTNSLSSYPWCLDIYNNISICSTEEKPCGYLNGSVVLNNFYGYISDNYIGSYSSGRMKCTYYIMPFIHPNLQQYAKIQLYIQKFSLAPDDKLSIYNGSNAYILLDLTGTFVQLGMIDMINSSNTTLELTSLGAAGVDYDGIHIEYNTVWSFDTLAEDSFCIQNLTTLNLSSGEAYIFPSTTLTAQLKPNSSVCYYDISPPVPQSIDSSNSSFINNTTDYNTTSITNMTTVMINNTTNTVNISLSVNITTLASNTSTDSLAPTNIITLNNNNTSMDNLVPINITELANSTFIENVLPTYITTVNNNTSMDSQNPINNTSFDSILIKFLEFDFDTYGYDNVTSAILDIYEFDKISGNIQKMITLTNETFTKGKYGILFSQPNDYIVSKYKINDIPRTIMFWIWCSKTIEKECTIEKTSCMNGTAKSMIVLGITDYRNNSNYINIILNFETGYLTIDFSSTTVITLQQDIRMEKWFHIGIVLLIIKDELFFYLNGKRMSSIVRSGSISSIIIPKGQLYIGGYSTILNSKYIPFLGKISGIQLFNDTKTYYDINETYLLRSYCQPTDPTLLLCYLFSNNNHIKAIDESYNENHGTFYGGSYILMDNLIKTIFSYNFTSLSSRVLLKYTPANIRRTLDKVPIPAIFRISYEAITCPNCTNNSTCIRGKCVCQLGFTGMDCSEMIQICNYPLQLYSKDEYGIINFNTRKYISPSIRNVNIFPIIYTNNNPYYGPINCSWIIQKSFSSIMIQMSTISLGLNEKISFSDYNKNDSFLHKDGSLYNLPYLIAKTIATYYSKGQFVYDKLIYNNLSYMDADITMKIIGKNIKNTDISYHKFQLRRYQSCVDATEYDLNKSYAIDLVKRWWWQNSDWFYTSKIDVLNIFFNTKNSTNVSATIIYKEINLNNVTNSVTAYPKVFLFQKQNTSLKCKDGSNYGLNKTIITTIVSRSWPSYSFTKKNNDFMNPFLKNIQMIPDPIFEFIGLPWFKRDGFRRNGIVDFYFKDIITSYLSYSENRTNDFTLMVDVSVQLTNTEQYLLCQELSLDHSLVLKIGPSIKKKGQWVFGKLNKSDRYRIDNPSSLSDTNIILTITSQNGLLTYFVNGIRFSSRNTTECTVDICITGSNNFTNLNRLTIGGRILSDGSVANVWSGLIYNVKLYNFIVPDAIILLSYLSNNNISHSISSFLPRYISINNINNIYAKMYIIHEMTVSSSNLSLSNASVTSKMINEFIFEKINCSLQIENWFMTKELMIKLIKSSINGSLYSSIIENDIIINNMDERSVTVSVYLKTKGSYSLFLFGREKMYTINSLNEYSDTTFYLLLKSFFKTIYFNHIKISNLWVNSISNDFAIVTYEIIDVYNSYQYVKAIFTNLNNTWNLDSQNVQYYKAVDEKFYSENECYTAAGSIVLTASTGVITDGSGDIGTVKPNKTCSWTIIAPPGDTININITRFNLICLYGNLLINETSQFIQLCKSSNFTSIPYIFTSISNMLNIQFTTYLIESEMNGFYATYKFSSHVETPDFFLSPIGIFRNWSLISSSIAGGSAQCYSNNLSDISGNLYLTKINNLFTTIPNTTCYEYDIQNSINSWECVGLSNEESNLNCLELVNDTTISDWYAYNRIDLRNPDVNWYNNSLIYNNKNPFLEITPYNSDSIISSRPFINGETSFVFINFQSKYGGNGFFKAQFFSTKLIFIAPSNYRPSDGSYGLGSSSRPYTYTLSYILSNIVSEGQRIRLYPGRYEGTGYCNLKFTKSLFIDSTNGYQWTIIDCNKNSRGWILSHTFGIISISGISFTRCFPQLNPLYGSALLINGEVRVENCRFFGNSHSSSGTVSVIVPGNLEISNSIFENNISPIGSAISIFSGILSVLNCTFKNNLCYHSKVGGTIYVSKYINEGITSTIKSVVTINNSFFINNTAVIGSSIASFLLTNIAIYDTSFLNNNALDGGDIYNEQTNMILTRVSILYFTGLSSGAIYATRSSIITIGQSTFLNNSLSAVSTDIINGNGGASITTECSTINVYNSRFESNKVKTSGGAIYSKRSSLTVTSCTFNYNSGGMYGGSITAINCYPLVSQYTTNGIAISYSVFMSNKVKDGGGASIFILSSFVILRRNHFIKDIALSGRGGSIYVKGLRSSQMPDVSSSGYTAWDPFSMKNYFYYFISQENQYSTIYADTSGGAIYLYDSEKTLLESEYFKNTGTDGSGGAATFDGNSLGIIRYNQVENTYSRNNDGGGFYFTNNSSYIIQSTNFRNCYSRFKGGSIALDSSMLYINNNTQFYNTSGELGGGIAVYSQSKLYTRSISFTLCTSNKGGAIYAVDTVITEYSLTEIRISDVKTYESGGSFYFVLANLKLRDIEVTKSYSNLGAVIFSEASILTFSKVSFKNSLATLDGGAIYSVSSSLIFDKISTLQNNTARNGGGIYSFASNLTVSMSEISQNNALTCGGGISSINSNLHIESCNFQSNIAIKGGSIYSDVSKLYIGQVDFGNNTAIEAGGGLYAQGDSNIILNASIFTNNKAMEGGAIKMVQIRFINISSSIFIRNYAVKDPFIPLNSSNMIQEKRMMESDIYVGGAISLRNIIHSCYISSTSFLNNQAYDNGGGIYANIGQSTVFLTKTTLIQNTATYGGALMLLSSKFIFKEGNTLNMNQAIEGGGGSFWIGLEPFGLNQSNVYYYNNKASYGNNYASTVYGLIPKYNGIYENSGDMIQNPIIIYVVDIYNNTINNDNNTEVQVFNYTNDSNLIGNLKKKAINGIVVFDNFGIISDPGHTVTIGISSGQLYVYGKIDIYLRKCIRGEILPNGVKKCTICPFGSFSWVPEEVACHPCPIGAVCFGGDHISNLNSYWRFPNTTGFCDNKISFGSCTFRNCENSLACKGMIISEAPFQATKLSNNNISNYTQDTLLISSTNMIHKYMPLLNSSVYLLGKKVKIISMDDNMTFGFKMIVRGNTSIDANNIYIYQYQYEKCANGYTGNVCSNCASRYHKNGVIDCKKCPDKVWIIYIVFVFGLFGLALIALILIKATISNLSKKNQISIILKILFSYLQFASIIRYLNVNWPKTIQNMLEIFEIISSPCDQLILIECLLDIYYSKTNKNNLSMYYQKLIFFLNVPIVLSVFLALFWWWYYNVYVVKKLKTIQWKELYTKSKEENNNNNPYFSFNNIRDMIMAIGDTVTDFVISKLSHESDLNDIKAGETLKKDKKKYTKEINKKIWDKWILSFIVLLFLLYPNITRQIFLLFSCKALGNDLNGSQLYFLSSDLDVPCYDKKHYQWIYYVAIPFLFIYIIGIPLSGLLVLYKMRMKIDDRNVKIQLSFLYDGYVTKYYYWEIWIMIQKVLLIFISIFLLKYDIVSQTILASGVVFIILYLQIQLMPYENNTLNNLEKFSLLINLFTLHCGLFFLKKGNDRTVQSLFSFFILLANLLFILKCIQLLYYEMKTEILSLMEYIKIKVKHKRKNFLSRIKRAKNIRQVEVLPEENYSFSDKHTDIHPKMLGEIKPKNNRLQKENKVAIDGEIDPNYSFSDGNTEVYFKTLNEAKEKNNLRQENNVKTDDKIKPNYSFYDKKTEVYPKKSNETQEKKFRQKDKIVERDDKIDPNDSFSDKNTKVNVMILNEVKEEKIWRQNEKKLEMDNKIEPTPIVKNKTIDKLAGGISKGHSIKKPKDYILDDQQQQNLEINRHRIKVVSHPKIDDLVATNKENSMTKEKSLPPIAISKKKTLIPIKMKVNATNAEKETDFIKYGKSMDVRQIKVVQQDLGHKYDNYDEFVIPNIDPMSESKVDHVEYDEKDLDTCKIKTETSNIVKKLKKRIFEDEIREKNTIKVGNPTPVQKIEVHPQDNNLNNNLKHNNDSYTKNNDSVDDMESKDLPKVKPRFSYNQLEVSLRNIKKNSLNIVDKVKNKILEEKDNIFNETIGNPMQVQKIEVFPQDKHVLHEEFDHFNLDGFHDKVKDTKQNEDELIDLLKINMQKKKNSSDIRQKSTLNSSVMPIIQENDKN